MHPKFTTNKTDIKLQVAGKIKAEDIELTNGKLATVATSETNSVPYFSDANGGMVNSIIKQNTNAIGIGTGTIDAGIRLQVAGKIKAEDIELTSSTSKIARTATASSPGVIPIFTDANGTLGNSPFVQAPAPQKHIELGTKGNTSGLRVSGDLEIGSHYELAQNQAITPSGNESKLTFFGEAPVAGGSASNTDQIYFRRKNEAFDKSTLQVNIGDDGVVESDKIAFGFTPVGGNFQPKAAIFASGDVWARKVKVTLDEIPDYVFLPNYKLRTLKETEAFITANGHLPEVPCAEEIAENGADLGELNKILLKKIEEMTLHLIRLEKEVNELKERK